MKDNSLDGHRGKVALSETNPAAAATTLKGDGTTTTATNFDDDYNEWELGIGDLIIDLDADIEKTNGGGETPAFLGMSSKSCSFEHQATVDKGLKMKIKRKTVGSRYAEAKHEIVQPPPHQADEKRRAGHKKSRAASAASSNGRDAPNGASAPSPAASPGRVPPPGSPLAEPAASAANLPPSSGSPPMPNLTVKLENGGGKFATSPATVVPPVAPPPPQKVAIAPAPVVQQQQQVIEERPASPPLKKQKLDSAAPAAPEGNDEDECPGSPTPEMKDTSTCTSVGTAVEPDCLGPCEPGTSVMLEGIVWQETEGGVLVVNVTWRGKTYVGTLLDCTKHDWAPPRFCESPTSDADSKTSKGRGGKRGGARGGCELSASFDARNCVQSKLRNGKGRRTTVNSNGFTVPSSPAKGSDGGGKRKSRPSSEPPSESSKRSRPQQQQQPATAAASTTAELITCPEPNCSKRYKHLNGLKYHRAHAHSGGGEKASASAEEAADTDNSKATNSSDNEEGSLQESASVSTSPAPSSSDALPPPPTKASTETSSSSSGLPDEPQQDVVPMDVSVDAAAPIETAVSAVTTSVITSSSSSSDAPPPHAFSQLSPAALAPPFPPAAASPPAPPLVDKSKTKQDRPTVVDKYKPKSPTSSSVVVTPAPNIRPIVPTPLITLSPALPPGGALLNPALKPIQPKPTILGEPSTVNPALEGLKKDKSGSSNKHKSKKSSGSSKGDKKPLVLPLSCDPLELTTTSAAPSSYPSLEAASPLAPKEDMSLPADDPLNENIQSPAYSDISDANDTAPVLESEVGGKEKEDKVGKSTPDAAQSPASASISGAYGMYPYYSQPPYLLPSVSPDNKVVVAAAVEPPKKVVDPVKDRPWSSPGVDRQPQQSHPPDPPPHHEMDKKAPSSQPPLSQGSRESPAAAAAVPEYPVPQHYPYPYGYVQGYPYPVDTSSYHHMHMLETDPHYKQQYKQYVDEHNRLYKEQQQQQHHHHQQQLQQQQHHHHHQSSSSSSHHHSSSQQHHHHQSKSHHSSVIKEERKERAVEKHAPNKEVVPEVVREMEMRPPSLKEKHQQSETHQILKENIELKSQMEEGGGGGKGKANQYEMAMLFERHKEDMRRYYTYQDRLVEQQQSKLEPGIHHHTHHHQTLGSSSSHHPYNKKDDHLLQHKQQQHYSDRAAASPAKDHVSSSSKHSLQHSSSPKGGLSSGKEYNSSSKKDQQGSKEDKKVKQEKAVVESEGQKPTMETTGPPPPPTNSYAYLHPSYLQPPPHAFAHMGPFEPMGYRGNPMLAPPPHYANAPYAMHPQIRYVAPPPPEDPKLHHAPSKALDMLHQVSQNYTTTHKIHELAEHAIMSPTPTAPPTASAPPTPTAVAAPTAVVPKGAPSSAAPPPPTPEGKGEGAGGPRDASRSPPTQRHLHTHHHTHVGVGYPIYDPYSVAAQKTFT